MSMVMGIHVRVAGGVVIGAALAGLWGCSKEAGGTAAAGSASAEAKGGKTAAVAKVTLESKNVRAAYEAELNDMKKMNDPMDKKIAAFEAKVGKPQKEEGGKKIWHAVDGSTCTKFTLESSGALEETTVDKSACGL